MSLNVMNCFYVLCKILLAFSQYNIQIVIVRIFSANAVDIDGILVPPDKIPETKKSLPRHKDWAFEDSTEATEDFKENKLCWPQANFNF